MSWFKAKDNVGTIACFPSTWILGDSSSIELFKIVQLLTVGTAMIAKIWIYNLVLLQWNDPQINASVGAVCIKFQQFQMKLLLSSHKDMWSHSANQRPDSILFVCQVFTVSHCVYQHSYTLLNFVLQL